MRIRLRASGWLPHAFVGLLAVPFIVHQNAWFEWANTLWVLDLQTAHISAHGLPTFFIDAPDMYFFPQQLFYAGPGLSALAYPSLLFGTWPVFAAVTAAAFSACSAGISWTARNLAVPPRLALVPGILFAVTPYTVSNLYGRGAWSEVVAVGALSVALGAATSILSGRVRSQPLGVAALAVAVAAIAGMHNLTLLYSALLAPILALALLPVLDGPGPVLWRRLGLVAVGAVIGLAIVGVFLVPNVWLSGRTVINTFSDIFLGKVHGFDRPDIIFSPIPRQPSGVFGGDVHTQTLVLPLIWFIGALGVAAYRRALTGRSRLTFGVIVVAGVAITVLIANPSWWLSFPSALKATQFPYRLVTYVSLLTVLGITVLLTIPAIRRSKPLIAALLVAGAWQCGVAGYLAIVAQARGGISKPTPSTITASTTPYGFTGGAQIIEFRLVIAHPLPDPGPTHDVAPIENDTPSTIQISGTQPTGTLVATRIVATPLIHVSGDVSVAGATKDGFAVLRVNRSPWHATVGSVARHA